MRTALAVASAALFLSLAITAVAASPSSGAHAEKQYFYQWTDESGGVHITDDLLNVPKQYRTKAIRTEVAPAPKTEQPESGQMPQATSPGEGSQGAENEGYLKAEWQQKILDAKRHLSDAEERYQNAEQARKSLEKKWGFGLYGYTAEVQKQLDRLEEEMKKAQLDIARAKDQIENVIPDEARKAGIPPGWLREVE